MRSCVHATKNELMQQINSCGGILNFNEYQQNNLRQKLLWLRPSKMTVKSISTTKLDQAMNSITY